MSGTRVTCEDVATGESESAVIENNYIVVCDGMYRVAHTNKYANGTVVVTLKPDAVIGPPAPGSPAEPETPAPSEPTAEALGLVLIAWMVHGTGVGFQDLLNVARAAGFDRDEVYADVLAAARPLNEARRAALGAAPPVPPQAETPAPSEPTAADWRATGAQRVNGENTYLWTIGTPRIRTTMATAFQTAIGWTVHIYTSRPGSGERRFPSEREAWEFVVACQFAAALNLTPSGRRTMSGDPEDDALTPLIDRGIEDGDWGSFLGAVLGSRFAADDGRYCKCPEPLVEQGRGKSTMCRRCLLVNEARYAEVTEFIRAPHEFEQNRDPESAAARLGMCSWCSGWRDDPCHASSVGGAATEGDR